MTGEHELERAKAKLAAQAYMLAQEAHRLSGEVFGFWDRLREYIAELDGQVFGFRYGLEQYVAELGNVRDIEYQAGVSLNSAAEQLGDFAEVIRYGCIAHELWKAQCSLTAVTSELEDAETGALGVVYSPEQLQQLRDEKQRLHDDITRLERQQEPEA